MFNEQCAIIEVPVPNHTEQILKLVGPLTITTLFDFRDRLRAQKAAKTVILDLSEVPYIDSAGVGAIVNAHVSCANAGRRLALVGVMDRVQTLLKLTRVDSVLAIFPTLTDAERALSDA